MADDATAAAAAAAAQGREGEAAVAPTPTPTPAPASAPGESSTRSPLEDSPVAPVAPPPAVPSAAAPVVVKKEKPSSSGPPPPSPAEDLNLQIPKAAIKRIMKLDPDTKQLSQVVRLNIARCVMIGGQAVGPLPPQVGQKKLRSIHPSTKQDAIVLVGKATELFVDSLARASQKMALANRRKTIKCVGRG